MAPTVGPAALAQAASNERVLYRSTGLDGTAIGASGIVALPPGEPPQGGFPVISWAHGTLGSADVCAPSRDTETSPTHSFNAAPHVLLNAFLQQGWAVVMSDYEGLGTPGPHPYLVGLSEARGILDNVRAARAVPAAVRSLRDRRTLPGRAGRAVCPLITRTGRPSCGSWGSRGDCAVVGDEGRVRRRKRIWREYSGPRVHRAVLDRGAADPSIKPAEVLTDEAYKVWPHTAERCRVGLSKPDSWGGLTGTNQLRQPPGPSTKKFLDQLDAMHPGVDIAVPIRIAQALVDQRIDVTLRGRSSMSCAPATASTTSPTRSTRSSPKATIPTSSATTSAR